MINLVESTLKEKRMENSMSFKLKNIERIVKELFRWIKQRFKGPSELLQAGRAGGMILCALLAAQFIYGSFLSYIIKKLPSFVLFAMGGSRCCFNN